MAIDFNTAFSRPQSALGRTSAANPILAARSDFRSLVLALQSGDVDGALRALDAVRQDLTGTSNTATDTSSRTLGRTPAVDQALDVLAQALYAREHPPSGPPPTTQNLPQGIDYTKFRSMTPYEVHLANPNGLPAGWDWGAWADAAGQPHPGTLDVSGAPLDARGFRLDTPAANFNWDRARPDFDWSRTGAWLTREGADGSTHTLTINPPRDWSGSIEFASSMVPSNLGSVSGVKYVVTNAAGRVLYASSGFESGASIDCRFPADGAEGPFTVSATYAGAGMQSFNCLHTP